MSEDVTSPYLFPCYTVLTPYNYQRPLEKFMSQLFPHCVKHFSPLIQVKRYLVEVRGESSPCMRRRLLWRLTQHYEWTVDALVKKLTYLVSLMDHISLQDLQSVRYPPVLGGCGRPDVILK